MKALLYSDWCMVKGVWKQYPIPVVIIVGVVAFTGVDAALGPDALVNHITTSAVTSGTIMMAMFGYFGFFGSDEREGWEAMRLALPVTRDHVVRSRYVTLVVWLFVVEFFVNVAGLLAAEVAAFVLYGRLGMCELKPIVIANIVILAGYLFYLAIETPIFFKLGLSKARMYFSLPFLACTLFALEPVRLFADNVGATINTFVGRIGSPWPLVAGGLAVAATLYYTSLLLSQRIYAKREL